ncbi:preprotein translocase, YajC subunit [Ehrlichia chaffeensis str. Heartland]|uniref:Sec translocon accessory complex subunit YajC n=2 Tax=Ehrlichia chaffeensis TaxID=945 RepID=Q2GFI9_EHRCR|nr:preprotein translocase subunit YajC [Ehrlichia chaffeensis]AAY79410.1 pOMP [Ehrlichia chaffeensis]ABD45214.1 preprotein translocase, YajC subunit [Ehrlichia chaffeensis str. Arkansas]AHX03326.1 preprotein translocase, YajC subunit [Ehrlichia chaffeensis str. Heartland]AHX05245.1 preprotein translocase, YajC subunit [Ehrlichia chaffeensis str. Jax]AHX06231.1 preprotein translocase, YajC subunit [Ehrlichia chaffeensis str. Liberty]
MSLISEVFAAAATTAPASGIGSSIAGLIPLVLIFCVFYFFIIRPQQKKIKEHNKLLDNIKKGDKVVISGSILGSVTKVDTTNGHFIVEISEGVEVKVLKSSVSEVLNKNNKPTSTAEASVAASNN